MISKDALKAHSRVHITVYKQEMLTDSSVGRGANNTEGSTAASPQTFTTEKRKIQAGNRV